MEEGLSQRRVKKTKGNTMAMASYLWKASHPDSNGQVYNSTCDRVKGVSRLPYIMLDKRFFNFYQILNCGDMFKYTILYEFS